MTPLNVRGQVVLEAVDRGSKSEREAVVLKTAAGASYVLRKQGGPAFGDSGLSHLVGRSISAQGVEAAGSTLIVHDWQPLD